MIYNHKLINDLAWAIGSPALVTSSPYNDERLVSNNWFNNQLSKHQDLLLQQDKSPQLIQTYLSTMPGFRLGLYFENLIAYWFQINPEYQILHKNLVISSDSRTIGEFDMILKNIFTGKIIHLETAVKFFMQVQHNARSHWLGPNLIDSLDLKYNKLINKQIVLSSQIVAKNKLIELGLKIDVHWIILKGRMFHKSTSNSEKNSWLTLTELERHSDSETARWVKLEKTHWLAEINNLAYNFLPNEIFTKSQLIDDLTTQLKDRPLCVAKIENDNEVNRFFVAPSNWQQRAMEYLG